jgi:deazaflavin-dependent oxidoreductase (nitroreductase family)
MASNIAERLARVANNGTLRLTHQGRKSGKEYQVTIWFVVDGARMFLPSANRNRNWVKNVTKTPRISLKIGDEVFRGEARPISGPERQPVMRLLDRKYWYAAPIMIIARMVFATGLATDMSTAFEVKFDEA